MLSNGMSQTTTNLIATLLHVPPRLLALTQQQQQHQHQQQHQQHQQQQQQHFRRTTCYHADYQSYLQENYHPARYNNHHNLTSVVHPTKSTTSNVSECISSHLNNSNFVNVQHIEPNQSISVQMSAATKFSPSNSSANTAMPLLPSIGFHA